MRWYCVHPSLPLQAELRIRAAADSSSSVCAFVPHGRAFAAYNLVCQVPGNDDDASPSSWLQVTYQNASSGEMKDGYIMASLPNRMPLVTPWESTDFRGCCKVLDPETLMFDGPLDGAQRLGAVQCVAYLYVIVDESEARVQIRHPELEKVWINKKDVQIVCTRLNHKACSTRHTFYELNEDLPENAQIAVREFPSTEAQAVGLLSRGETLEVSVRGGNWLQIIGGSLDRAWIMWRTEDLELLQESPDIFSGNCRRLIKDLGGSAGAESAANMVLVEEHTVPSHSDQTVCTSPLSVTPETDYKVNSTLEISDAQAIASKHAAITTNNSASVGVAKTSQARPASALCKGFDDADASGTEPLQSSFTSGDGISSTIGSGADTCEKDVEPAFAVQASDDRPIRPAQSAFEQMRSDVNVGGADSVVMAQPTIDDMENTEQTVSKLSASAASADSDIAQNSLGDTDITIGGGISSTIGSEADTCEKDVEPAFAVQASDDRPIRPAQSTFEQMRSDVNVGGADSVVMAQPTIDDMENTEQTVSKLSASAASADSDIAQNSLGDTDITIGGGISSTIGSEADTCEKDVEPAFAVQASDDRPIRPAQSTFEQMRSDVNVGGADSVVMAQPTIDDMENTEQTVSKLSASAASADSDIAQNSLGDTDITIGGGISSTIGSEADTCEKDVEPAFAVQASDDRPIRPAQSAFEQMRSDVNVGGADSVVMAQPTIDDMENTEQTVSKLSASAASADSDIAQNSLGDTDITIGGGISSTIGSEADTCEKDVEPAFAVQASDDRPIRPAQSAFEQMRSDVNVGGADSVVMAQPTIDDMENTEQTVSKLSASAASADSDIAQNSLGDTDITIGGGISSTIGSEADTCEKDVEPAFAVQASDDRPIRPAQSTFEQMRSDVNVGGADSVVMAQPTIDDMENTEQTVSKLSASAASADSDIAQNSLGDTDITIGGGISSTIGSEADTCEKDVEPAFAVQASDDRPIRPAQSAFEQMRSDVNVGGADSVVMAQPTIDDMENTEQTVSKLSASAASADSDIAQNSLGDTDITIGGGISSTIGSEADTCEKDVEPAFAVQASDDRPIRPAQSTFEQMRSDVNVGGADSVVMAQPTIDDMENTEQTVSKLSASAASADSDIAQNSLGDTDITIGGGISSTIGSEADTCEKDVEPAFAVQASDDRPIRPAQSAFEQMRSDVNVGGADSVVMAQPTIDDMENTEQTVSKLSASAASADSDIAQNSLGDTDITIGGGISSTIGSEADTCEKDVEPAFAVQASDDRPIRPAQSTFEQMRSDVNVGGADSVVMAQPTIDDMENTEQTVSKLSASAASADSDIAQNSLGDTDITIGGGISSTIGSEADTCEKDVEPAFAVQASDDRPIRPAQSAFEQMRSDVNVGGADSVVMAQPTIDDMENTEQTVSKLSASAASADSDIAQNSLGDTDITIGGGISSTIGSEADTCEKDVEPAFAVQASDDRPIRPAQSAFEQMRSDVNVGGADSVVMAQPTIDDMENTEQTVSKLSASAASADSDIAQNSLGDTDITIGGGISSTIGSEADTCEKDVEPAFAVQASDDRPIRPAQSTFEQMRSDVNVGGADSVVMAQPTIDDMENTEQTVSKLSASAASADSDIAQNSLGDTDITIGGGISSTIGSEADTCEKDVEPAFAVQASDDRPIRPAQSTFEQMRSDVNVGGADSVVMAQPTIDDMENTEQTVSKLSASAASADSDIAQNSLGDTDITIGGGISSTIGSEADTCEKDVEPAFAVQASDDRPIRPAQSAFEQMRSDVNVGGADSVVMAQPTIDDMENTEQTVSKLSASAASADSDIAQNSPGDTDITIGGGISSTIGSEADTCEKDVEPAFAVQASDDRPIRPAHSTFEQMRSDVNVGGADIVVMAQPTIDDMENTEQTVSKLSASAASADSDIAQNSLGDTDITIGGGISSTIGSEADTCEKDVEPAFAVQASDDRPIRPAQSTFEQMRSDVNVGGADSVVMAQPTIDDMENTEQTVSKLSASAASADSDIAQNSLGDTDITIGGGISSTIGSEADTCEKDVEPAFAVQASDDRPIRPAQSAFEQMRSDVNVGGADSVVMAQPTIDDMENTEQTVSKLSASAASADSDIAQNSPGDTDITIGGGISSTIGSEADTCEKDVEPAFAVQASDDRPIRPAHSTFEQMRSDVNVGGADIVVMAQPTIDDMENTEQTVSKLSASAASADSDIAQNSLGDTDITIGGGISSTIGSEADTCEKDVEPAFAVQASDDRPIRPAQSAFEQMRSDVNVGGADSVVMAQPTIDDMENTEQTVSKLSASAASADSDIAQNSLGDTDITIGGGISSTIGSEADTCEKDVEPAFAVQASDDRPIRPAQSTFEQMRSDVNVGGADSVVMAQPTIDDMENTEQTVSKLSASAASADSDIAQNSLGDTDITIGGGISSTIGSEADTCEKDVEPAFAVQASDDRPIRPAHSTFEQMRSDVNVGGADSVVMAQPTIDDMENTEQTVSKLSPSYVSAASADGDYSLKAIVDPATYASGAGDVLGNGIEEGAMGRHNAFALDNVVLPVHVRFSGAPEKFTAAVELVVDTENGDGSRLNGGTYLADEVEVDTIVRTALVRDYLSAFSDSADGLSSGDIETKHDGNDRPSVIPPCTFDGNYAELDTTFGSENGEIALLGSSEDAFDPVDELLPAMYDESNAWPEDAALDAEPLKKAALLRCRNASFEARSDPSINESPCRPVNETILDVDAVQPDGIALLQASGIIRYCEYKQAHNISADKLSLAVYEANEDDPDLVLQALVGNDPLSDDWFHDVSPSPSHSDAKKFDMSAAGPRSTFDLIMSNASPEEILAAELSNDDCGDFDLVVSFRYPVPGRRGRKPGRRHSSFTHLPAAHAHTGYESEIPDAVDDNGVATHDAPLLASKHIAKPSRENATVGAMPAPSSRLRRKTFTTSAGASMLPPTDTSIARPQSLMQTVQAASPVSSARATSIDSIPRLKALASSASNVLPTARSFLQRRSLPTSSPSSIKAPAASGATRNSIANSSKLAEGSRLPAPQRTFGFRRPSSGLTKRT